MPVRGRPYPWGVEVHNEDHFDACEDVHGGAPRVHHYRPLRELADGQAGLDAVKSVAFHVCIRIIHIESLLSPAIRILEERIIHEANLVRMEAEMKMSSSRRCRRGKPSSSSLQKRSTLVIVS